MDEIVGSLEGKLFKFKLYLLSPSSPRKPLQIGRIKYKRSNQRNAEGKNKYESQAYPPTTVKLHAETLDFSIGLIFGRTSDHICQGPLPFDLVIILLRFRPKKII